ncbi:MAG: MBOAT family protein [Clostridia bacterium]|nr:MBOAT family protein [Clostridia bacterium]
MSILSFYFLAFLLVLTVLYYIVPNPIKPLILLAGNTYFYLQFGTQYFFFLMSGIVLAFVGALVLERAKTILSKKVTLGILLFLNIGFLFYVKFTPYLLNVAKRFVSFEASGILKTVVVPVGIAFYTLQLCGYLMDVYRGKHPAERNILKFAAFSTFFPLMLQGPISRYSQLADQIYSKGKRKDIYRNFTYGAQLILWGFFKKLVIADRAALLVNAVFNQHSSYSGMTVILAVVLYTVQIYTDFSGCVDICRGAAQLFGIDVIENFKQPYFAKSTQDFWKRWHISLSSWFRDYLYIPLGGNRKGALRKYINLVIVFFASGLWHGVGLHYVAWGLMQATFQIVGALTLPIKEKWKVDRSRGLPLVLQHASTLVLINLSWLVFRANGLTAAVEMTKSIFTFSPLPKTLPGMTYLDLIVVALSLIVVLSVSYYREKGYRIRDEVSKLFLPLRWTLYLLLFAAVVWFGIYGPGYSDSAFIYMNF